LLDCDAGADFHVEQGAKSQLTLCIFMGWGPH